jgi:murein tripeptide amidase MpaA
MKNILFALAALIIIAAGIYYFINSSTSPEGTYERAEVTPSQPDTDATSREPENDPVIEPETETNETERGPITTIGSSVSGSPIQAYHFGTGEKEVLLIGGIHGGYSWNTALLGYELVDWFSANPALVPDDLTVTIIPVLNPDGLTKIAGTADRFSATDITGTANEKVAARFNTNNVDLNRNFDCEWSASGTWQNQTVSGGSAPFSEPESQAVRDYVLTHEATAVIAWYSAAGGVYASRCNGEIMTATKTLMNNFAQASGYTAYDDYDYYEITGDMVNWLAKNEIPAVSVLLTTHEGTELAKNKAGVTAVLTALSR